jgi:hypothetical protein
MSAFALDTTNTLIQLNVAWEDGELVLIDTWFTQVAGLDTLGDVFNTDYKELSMLVTTPQDVLNVLQPSLRQTIRALVQLKSYMEVVTQDFAIDQLPNSVELLKMRTIAYKKCATSMKFTIHIPNMEDMSDQTWPDHKTTILILLEGYGLSALIHPNAEVRYTTYDKVFGAALRLALQDSNMSFITRNADSSFSRMYNKLLAWYESAQCKTNRIKATRQLLNERTVDNLTEVAAYVNDMVNGFCTLADLGSPQDEAQKVSGLKDGIELLQVKTPMESLPTGTTLEAALEKIRSVLPCNVETLTTGTIRRFGENPGTDKTRNDKRASSSGGDLKTKKKRNVPYVQPEAYKKLTEDEQQDVINGRSSSKLLARIKQVESETAGSSKEAAGKSSKKTSKENKKRKDGKKSEKPAKSDKANKQTKKDTKSALAKAKLAKSKKPDAKFKSLSKKDRSKKSIRRIAENAGRAPRDGRLVDDDGSIDDSE